MMLLLRGNNLISAQLYPRWFLSQRGIPCKSIAVGYTEHLYFRDSSAVSQAIDRAAKQLIKQKEVTVTSSLPFWTTVLGNAEMGNYFKETYDTSLALSIKKTITVLDTFLNGNIIIVLVSKSGCDKFKKDSMNFPTKFLSTPQWVTNIPRDNKCYYAIGSATEYFYKTSSWREAEENALISLAEAKQSAISSLQKSEYLGEEMRKEDVSVNLKNYEILERWKDNYEKIYNVLARIPRR